MKIKILFATLLTLALFTAGHAQTAMAQDKFGIESAGIVFEFDHAKNQMIQKRGGQERVFTKEN
jgi:Skp family chaperone for outer membrane proteins